MRMTIARISNTNVMAVKKGLLAAVATGDTVLDLAEVTTVDSSAVSLLLAFVRAVKARGRRPEIRNMPDDLLEFMKVYGVYDLISPWMQKTSPLNL